MSRKTDEFKIYVMHQRLRVENLTTCYHKKKIEVSFSCVCPVIDNEFRHNIVKVVCGSEAALTMTKFVLNNRADA